MHAKILAYITERQLFLPTDRLLVAVSGGRDSVALLDVLLGLGYQVGIAHCNFQLRGEESMGDEDFVRGLGKQYQVPCYVTRFETAKYAEEKNISIQLSARELRYAWFAEVLQREAYDYLITAHHLNDNLETVLHRLVRGTGIVGLQGIPAQYDKIARPMLGVSQAEIAQYAQTHQLAWREDSSNAQDKYTRNFLRHNVVPLLKQLNPNLEETFAQTLERLQGYASHFQASAQALRAQVVRETQQATYLHIAPLLAQTAGKVFVAELLQPYQFHYEQVQRIWQKMQENAIGTLFFSPTHSLVIDRDHIVLKPKHFESSQTYLLAHGQASLQTPHFTLSANWQASPDSPTDAQNILLDTDTLQFPLEVRRWRAGEFFRPLGMGGKKKKIADFLNDQKVPRNLKPDVWVLCSGEEIVWVMGFRMAHTFRLTEKTQSITYLSCSDFY